MVNAYLAVAEAARGHNLIEVESLLIGLLAGQAEELSSYLSRDRAVSVPLLTSFFGCLATAVAYLHDNKIRHKDIKLENNLVKDRKILLTDFGTFRNWSDDTKSATSETVAVHTRYRTPEAADHAVSFPCNTRKEP